MGLGGSKVQKQMKNIFILKQVNKAKDMLKGYNF